MPGKRKRDGSKCDDTPGIAPDHAPSKPESAHDIFRAHFEDQFQPLKAEVHTFEADSQPDLETPPEIIEESEWDGLSASDDDTRTVEVIDYTRTPRSERDELSKAESKSFMTSKPPTMRTETRLPPGSRLVKDSGQEDANDAANLKHDVALQRLLKESHLLDTSASLSPSSYKRHKAIDLRLLSLGSRASIFEQDRMPLSHRKGIAIKSAQREEKRRREAKESGIILEKPTKLKPSTDRKRDIGPDGPSVGTFKRGMLRLSKADVTDIERPKDGSGKYQKRRSGKR
ncbi:MAG: hypothetical protein M1833_000077 [Piccolia ochrophora]|nr:MAG: hypothetical protein M1833_000077 [Piccolia ochrophora]